MTATRKKTDVRVEDVFQSVFFFSQKATSQMWCIWDCDYCVLYAYIVYLVNSVWLTIMFWYAMSHCEYSVLYHLMSVHACVVQSMSCVSQLRVFAPLQAPHVTLAV